MVSISIPIPYLRPSFLVARPSHWFSIAASPTCASLRPNPQTPLLGRHSVLDTACPVLDTGESSRIFWIPAFAGMTTSRQAVGNTTPRDLIRNCRTQVDGPFSLSLGFSGHRLIIICSSISPSFSLRFCQRQLTQEFENICPLEIGCFLTSGIFQDPREV